VNILCCEVFDSVRSWLGKEMGFSGKAQKGYRRKVTLFVGFSRTAKCQPKIKIQSLNHFPVMHNQLDESVTLRGISNMALIVLRNSGKKI
jgi:hypothetical protein